MPVTIRRIDSVEADYRCYFCFARTFERLIEKHTLSATEKKALAAELFSLFHNGTSGFSVPTLSRELCRLFRERSGIADPYQQIKYESNERLLGEYAMFREMIDQSDDPFEIALRLAVAGNIIDYGVSDHHDLEETMAKVLDSQIGRASCRERV